jgi:hypothetical protein
MKKGAFFQTLTQRLIDVLILLIVAIATVVVLTGVLYSIKAGWGLYQSTAVGENYLNRQNVPGLVQFACSVNIFVLAIETVVITLGVSMAMGVLSQFLGLLSQLYRNKSLPVRILLWGFPIAWLTALYLQEIGISHDLLFLFFLGVLPALCLMDRSFRLAHQLVPEVEMLLVRYSMPARLWEALNHCLSLIFISTVISVMALYLLLGVIESGFSRAFMPFPHIESPSWGRIPLDLTPPGLVEVAFMLSLTVFCICAVPSVAAQLFHALKGFYVPLSSPIKFLVFGPVFLFVSALGISCFHQLEPFFGAILLAIVPTFSIYPGLLNQLPDIVPEMGEVVCRLDPGVGETVNLAGVFKWLGRKVVFRE